MLWLRWLTTRPRGQTSWERGQQCMKTRTRPRPGATRPRPRPLASRPRWYWSNTSIVVKYAYFPTVCSQNNAFVEWSYLARKCIKFHLQPSKFEKFSRGEPPGPLLIGYGEECWREGEGLKHRCKNVFLYISLKHVFMFIYFLFFLCFLMSCFWCC